MNSHRQTRPATTRYLFLRGVSALAIFALLAICAVIFVRLSGKLVAPPTALAATVRTVVGIAFGFLLVGLGLRIERRLAQRLDKATGRTGYDASAILENLAHKARTASSRDELAALLARNLEEALHPEFLTVYLQGDDGYLLAGSGKAPQSLTAIPLELPPLKELARRGSPWDVPPDIRQAATVLFPRPLVPVCLVPVLGQERRLIGLLMLGQRTSGQPYSDNDKRLLSLVADQAGLALENIRLAQEMAAHTEADRQVTREWELAAEVQRKLLPERPPQLTTLDLAAVCKPNLPVGGDFYDFLTTRTGRLGIVVGDVMGKGLSAALLAASLQAHLREQYAMTISELAAALEAVNGQFHASSRGSRFATLFFGEYDEGRRQLRYANCGHHPPLLMRADGTVEWLDPTGTILGVFEQWDGSLGEVQLAPGDTLLVYSDGLVEARNSGGEEFGREVLARIVCNNHEAPLPALLDAILTAAKQFSDLSHQDDLTLVLARAR